MPLNADTTRFNPRLSRANQPALGVVEPILTLELMLGLFLRLGHLPDGLMVRKEILLVKCRTLTTRAVPLLQVLILAAERAQAVTVKIAETVGQLAKVGTPPHISRWDLLWPPVLGPSIGVEQVIQADTQGVLGQKQKALILGMEGHSRQGATSSRGHLFGHFQRMQHRPCNHALALAITILESPNILTPQMLVAPLTHTSGIS